MEHVCQWCGEPFTARQGARYCSSTCRSRAQRAAQRGIGVCSDVLSPYVSGISGSDLERTVARAHTAAEDMSRAALHTSQPLAGALGRAAAGMEEALRREGL